ncbi:MAG: ParB N-terminal domain-containing protein, partial [Actinobacteria bacterium]|nr:ParB N-terminal domain-containing protein [Actinomycetota bacterium]
MATITPEAGRQLAPDQIRVPRNVRALDDAHVQALAGSIALQGMLVPVVVRDTGNGFELVAGFHRIAAAKTLGLSEVPVVVREAQTEDADRAVENVTSCRRRHDVTNAECDGMPTWVRKVPQTARSAGCEVFITAGSEPSLRSGCHRSREKIVVRERPSVARVVGPLGPYAPGFRAWLAQRGYRPSSVETQAFLMGHLSRWMNEQGMQASAFTNEAAERYLQVRRQSHSSLSGSRGLEQLLAYLRGVGVVPEPAAPGSPAEAVIVGYREYLLAERGLVEGSVVLRARVARLFLGELSGPIEVALAQLGPVDVTRFVVAQCGDGRRGTAWASTLVSGLRSLLVFLHVTGRVPVALAVAVPSVASWRLSSLPRGLDRDHVERIVASCDR